jgi:hypothetical protein
MAGLQNYVDSRDEKPTVDYSSRQRVERSYRNILVDPGMPIPAEQASDSAARDHSTGNAAEVMVAERQRCTHLAARLRTSFLNR